MQAEDADMKLNISEKVMFLIHDRVQNFRSFPLLILVLNKNVLESVMHIDRRKFINAFFASNQVNYTQALIN